MGRPSFRRHFQVPLRACVRFRRDEDAQKSASAGCSPRRREEAPLTLVLLVASLLAVALWEFCQPRRRREFPALRRRLGNLGIWLLNLILVDFIFAPTETFRPELATVL